MTVFLIVVLSLCACTSVPKGCTIEGTVKDKSYEGKQVYLRHALTPETYDSTIVKIFYSKHPGFSISSISLFYHSAI